MSIAVNPYTKKVYVGYSNSHNFPLLIIEDVLLVDNKGEEVKIGFYYPCSSDIAVNLEKNHLYVSFDCRDGIFLIKESNESIPTKTTTLGTNNTNIAFNPATDKIYVLDTESNLVYTKDAKI